jgi:hypothetical protein
MLDADSRSGIYGHTGKQDSNKQDDKMKRDETILGVPPPAPKPRLPAGLNW